MAKLKLIETIQTKLPTLSKTDGQLIVIRDNASLYVDLDGARIYISDWIDVSTDTDRLAMLTPLSNKYYYVVETNKIWRYIGGSWIQITLHNASEVLYDNTTSGLSATNVNSAIDEISSSVDTLEETVAYISDDNDVVSDIGTVLTTQNIIDGVDNSSTNMVLSANQGKILNERISDVATANNAAIEAETSARNSAILAEQTARKNADATEKSERQSDIAKEKSERQSAIATEKSERQTEIAVERARIDAFVAMPEGATTNDTELQDIRIKTDGTTSTTAGNAVREQINRLSSEIVDVKSFVGAEKSIELNWINGGYIDDKNGAVITFDRWKYTDFIRIGRPDFLIGSVLAATSSFAFNCFYDANKQFIASFDSSLEKITVPTNAEYIRCSLLVVDDVLLTPFTYPLVDRALKSDIQTNNNGVVSLNKDIEPFIIQNKSKGAGCFDTNVPPLTFIHFTDIHGNVKNWERVIQFGNHYKDYVDFLFHSGDYCPSYQGNAMDLYSMSKYKPEKPLYQCVGNHDVFSTENGGVNSDKSVAHGILFSHVDNWGVTFMDIDNSMTYYKDYPTNKVRMIVLDNYYDLELQATWLESRLNEAKTLGYHVFTVSHEMTYPIIDKLDTPFCTIDDFESKGGNKHSKFDFDGVIANWIQSGGKFVAHFGGHEHSDFIGYTDSGVLNVIVSGALTSGIWTDGDRIENTRTQDCFNVVGVDVSNGVLKIVRVGNNADHYLREKKVLCFDYINKKIIK